MAIVFLLNLLMFVYQVKLIKDTQKIMVELAFLREAIRTSSHDNKDMKLIRDQIEMTRDEIGLLLDTYTTKNKWR